jgi:tetraacyldisaccharide 4'-kinase
MSNGKRNKIIWALYPLTWIYSGVATLRNKLFDCGVLRSRSFDVPIICVGNLSVGGTGKTPHTEYLIRLLKDEFRVAVLSRGYKRKSKGYLLADEKSDARLIGDEPYQMKSKFPGIRMAVDADRCHGVEQLLNLSPSPEVILLDDAYQHRYIKAGLYILLTDYHRLFSDDAVLPAGRLRESASGKRRAQIVIVTKSPADISDEECREIAAKLSLSPEQQLFFSCFRYGELQPLFGECGQTAPELSRTDVLLVTGIASPRPLIDALRPKVRSIETLTFGDHHDFSADDIRQIAERFGAMKSDGNKIIITTEKDGTRIKCHNLLIDSLKQYIFVQPIEIGILQDKLDIFNQHIIGYVRKDSRNSRLS